MIRAALGSFLAATVVALTACTPGGGGSTSTSPMPPAAGEKLPSSIGPGEGQLNLITWEGYTDDSWVQAFTQQTGCKVNSRFVGTSGEMTTLMSNGGAGQWDMVSAPGDVSLGLIYDGEVQPMNTALIPSWSDFISSFKSPAYNTVAGVHYGISVQWSPNLLIYNTKKFSAAPTSWAAIYDSTNNGMIAIPDNPMQIADAALYLAKTQPTTGISDPFELNRRQFDAAVTLLRQQRPLVRGYWAIASEEIKMFEDGTVVVGSAAPYQAIDLQSIGIPVGESLPAEGATAFADSWMLAAKAPHPNCAYLWTAYVTTPHVQAQQAILFGETPVNSKACDEMNSLQAGSCAEYHADAANSPLTHLTFWKTPMAACGAGKACVPYDEWISAWNAIKA